LGVGNNAPSYPLDVTGQVRITSQLGIGITPSVNRGINAFFSQTVAATDALGGYVIGQNDYAAGAQSGAAYGWLSEAKQNQATILAEAIGYHGGVTISIDDGTITTAYVMRARINLPAAAAGHPRTITTAYMYGMSLAFGANDVIGTLYGFHMPSVSATTKWGVYIADTAANSYFAAQAQFAVGAVGAPGQAWIGDLTTGRYHPAASTDAVTIAGVERFRVGAGGIGIVATNEIFLDAVALSGNTSIRERTADVICLKAGGADQFEVRTDHMYGRPTTYAPAADGEFGFNTTYNALVHRIGGQLHYNGNGLYSLATPESVNGAGVKAETAFAANHPVPTTLWAAGKAFEIIAYVYADLQGTGSCWISIRLTASPVGLGGILVVGPLNISGSGEGLYGNGLIIARVVCNTTGAGGTVTCMGEGRRVSQAADTEQMVAMPSGGGMMMYRDAGTEAVNTTTALKFRVTYEVTGGGPGDWHATLKQLLVRSIN
jgi:hypothetical protein